MMAFQIEYTNSYTKHGCNFTGNLAVINCEAERQRHPGYGRFGAMLFLEVADVAIEHLLRQHPEADILIGMPDVVARIKAVQ